jgi:hypothetical protein
VFVLIYCDSAARRNSSGRKDIRRKFTVDSAWWLEEDVPVAKSVEILGVEVDSVDLPALEATISSCFGNVVWRSVQEISTRRFG